MYPFLQHLFLSRRQHHILWHAHKFERPERFADLFPVGHSLNQHHNMPALALVLEHGGNCLLLHLHFQYADPFAVVLGLHIFVHAAIKLLAEQNHFRIVQHDPPVVSIQLRVVQQR